MRSYPSPQPDRRAARLAAVLLAIVIASGCGSAAPSGRGSPLPVPSAGETTAPPTPSALETASPEPAVPTPPESVKTHWEQAGTLHLAHVAPHVLRLGDGRVMVVGSEGLNTYEYGDAVAEESRFVEVWDPADGEWHRAESLNKARGGFAAVTLDDGRVLVAGGLSPDLKSYSSAYLFDPATGHWTKGGLMDTARADPVAAVLADGRVLVAGGRYSAGEGDYPWARGSGVQLAAYREPAAGVAPGSPPVDDADPGPVGHPLATAEIYDPRTDTWAATGAMRYPRVGAQAVTLADGRVLVWGGVDETDERGTSLGEIYDPATGRFRPAPVLPELTTKAIRALVVPPQDGTVTPSPYGETLVALPDGGALLVDAASTWGDVLVTRTMRYDAARDDWRQVGPLYATTDWWDEGGAGTHWGTLRPDGIIVPLPGGRVLFAGGVRKRAAEVLDPDAGTWTALPKLPAARPAGIGLVLDDGSVLVVPSGGYTDAFRLVPGS